MTSPACGKSAIAPRYENRTAIGRSPRAGLYTGDQSSCGKSLTSFEGASSCSPCTGAAAAAPGDTPGTGWLIRADAIHNAKAAHSSVNATDNARRSRSIVHPGGGDEHRSCQRRKATIDAEEHQRVRVACNVHRALHESRNQMRDASRRAPAHLACGMLSAMRQELAK